MNNKQWTIFFKVMILVPLSFYLMLNGMDYQAVKNARVKERYEQIGGEIDPTKLEMSHKRERSDGKEDTNLGDQKKLREDEQERVARLFVAATQGTLSAEDLRATDVFLRGHQGSTLLHIASVNGHRQVVGLLLDRGAKIYAATLYGWTALHCAGNRAVAELLLDRGAQIDDVGDGMTSLHCAAGGGHRAIVELLLDRGAQIDAVVQDGVTSLYLAARAGHRSVVELLLDRGAQIDAVRDEGSTVLHSAAEEGHREVVELLLDRGALIGAFDEDVLATALCWAAEEGHREVVGLLLDRGALIGAFDRYGETALHRASMNGHREVVELIVGRMMLKPNDEQVARARAQIGKILLWEKLGRKVYAHKLPKDILGYMLLLDESLCRDFAIILLGKCDRGSRIDTTSCLACDKVLLCGARMILAENGALLDDVYKKLPKASKLESLFAPLDREKNLSGYILGVFTKKIQNGQ